MRPYVVVGLAFAFAASAVPARAATGCGADALLTLTNTGSGPVGLATYRATFDMDHSGCDATAVAVTVASAFGTPAGCLDLGGGCAADGLGVIDGRFQVAFAGLAVSGGTAIPVQRSCSIVLNPTPGDSTYC